jgi:hypothetical protein
MTGQWLLLVEGDEEKRVIPYLMDRHVICGGKEIEWVVPLEAHEGFIDLSLLRPR